MIYIYWYTYIKDTMIWYAYCAYNSKNGEVPILLSVQKNVFTCQRSNIDFPLKIRNISSDFLETKKPVQKYHEKNQSIKKDKKIRRHVPLM